MVAILQLRSCNLGCTSGLKELSRHLWHCPRCDVHLTTLYLCPECNTRWSSSVLWQAYDVADTDEQARQAFIARYDREPRLVWRDGGCVHAGPITKAEHDVKMGKADAV